MGPGGEVFIAWREVPGGGVMLGKVNRDRNGDIKIRLLL